MNFRLFLLGIFAGVIFLNSCNDDLNSVGMGMKPDTDGNSTRTDTFQIIASTISAENSIYARTINGLLGNISDPLYGDFKADYLCEFYCPENFSFKDADPVKAREGLNPIDSVKIYLYYNTWVGDSIAPMTVNIYEVTNPLEKNYYTNIDPEDYCDFSNLLGSTTYTPRNYNLTDSAWNAIITGSSSMPSISIGGDVLNKFGKDFYKATIENPENFKDQTAFNDYFKGIYVTNSDNSKGNVLNIYETAIIFFFEKEGTTTASNGEDSVYVYTAGQVFTPTLEVIQMNRFDSDIDIEELERKTNGESVFVKAPAGVYTQLNIPTATESLIDKIEGRTINNLFFNIKLRKEQEGEYALTPPPYLLLLPKDSMYVHFEKNRLADSNVQSYLGTYTASNRSYDFGNIANLVSVQMNSDRDKDIEMVLVPVDVTKDSNYGTVTDIVPSVALSAAEIRIEDDLMEFHITSSKFAEDE